eukprot:1516357-Pyramimonas_sp.AAC.2
MLRVARARRHVTKGRRRDRRRGVCRRSCVRLRYTNQYSAFRIFPRISTVIYPAVGRLDGRPRVDSEVRAVCIALSRDASPRRLWEEEEEDDPLVGWSTLRAGSGGGARTNACTRGKRDPRAQGWTDAAS